MTNKLFPFATLLSLSICLSPQAQTPAPWQSRLKKLQVDHRKAVEQQVSLETLAVQMGLAWPLPKQTLSADEAKVEVERRLLAAVDAQLPKVAEAELQKEAEEMYRVWKKGDRVAFRDRLGRQHKGMITSLSQTRIRVGGVWITATDFTRDMLIHLDEEKSKETIKLDVESKQRTNKIQRRLLFERLESEGELAEQVYQENAFVRFQNAWHTSDDVVNTLREIQQRQVDKRYQQSINDHLQAHGFASYKGRWMPVQVAQKLRREEAKRQAEQRRQAERERQEARWEREREERRQRAMSDLLEQQRKERERQLAEAARESAEIGIPACINGLLDEQAKGNVGIAYWADGANTSKLFAPVNWTIMQVQIAGTLAFVNVRINSSNKGGMPIRALWQFMLRYDGTWKVLDISEAD